MLATLEKWQPQMLSALRIFLALLYLQSGLSKYFGWPGPQPQNFTMFSLFGLAGLIEIFGSLLLLLGLWTREAAFIMSGEMAVAYLLRRVLTGASFYPIVNGGYLESLLSFVFLYFAFAGPGPWSVDAMRAKR
ncbi:MAG TPA: DoxX family protein [Stellaceae bacterium]|nr:DoxX family protein [Stellaceae bacterium]